MTPIERRRRRVTEIRRKVAAVSVAAFIGLFSGLYVQLASGHDPAIGAGTSASATTAKSSASGATEEGTTTEDTTTTDDTTTDDTTTDDTTTDDSATTEDTFDAQPMTSAQS